MTATTDNRTGPEGERASGPDSQNRRDRDTATMTLFEHLSELRNRVIVCLIAIAAGMVVIWFLYNDLAHYMEGPLRDYAKHHPHKVLTSQLVTLSPLEGFTTRLKVCGYGGLVLAAPVLLWELWRFVTPGLYRNEKKYVIPFLGAGIVLFASGVTTSVLVFPKALTWLINVSGTGVSPLFSPARYFTLYVAMCVVFGAVFMYPLILVSLELTGVVPSARWRKWRRPAIVVLSLVAAVVTPSSDPFSFLAMAVPMVVLYEASIILGRILGK